MSQKKFYETAEFKKQQKEWYAKAEAAGFDDIEKNEDETVIRPQEFTTPSKDKVEYVDFIQTVGGLDHHELCQVILRDFKFKRDIDREIFRLYAEGSTLRQISDKLPTLGHKAMTFKAVDLVIQKIKTQYLKG